MSDRTVTLGEYMVGRVGLWKATKVAAFIYAWGIYTEKEEGRHTMEGYTAYWRQSISTTYRERDLFKICWPDQKDPTQIWLSFRLKHPADSGVTRDAGAIQVLAMPGMVL
jgi:hypothetical protein